MVENKTVIKDRLLLKIKEDITTVEDGLWNR